MHSVHTHNQEQLDELENDCTDIEEDLLQRQVQQETTSGMRKSASSLELPTTVQEKEKLQETRLKLQTTSDALQPIINVFYLQLQLLQSIQDGEKIANKAMEFMGEQGELENILIDLEVSTVYTALAIDLNIQLVILYAPILQYIHVSMQPCFTPYIRTLYLYE